MAASVSRTAPRCGAPRCAQGEAPVERLQPCRRRAVAWISFSLAARRRFPRPIIAGASERAPARPDMTSPPRRRARWQCPAAARRSHHDNNARRRNWPLRRRRGRGYRAKAGTRRHSVVHRSTRFRLRARRDSVSGIGQPAQGEQHRTRRQPRLPRDISSALWPDGAPADSRPARPATFYACATDTATLIHDFTFIAEG